jgi:hypothetical protein
MTDKLHVYALTMKALMDKRRIIVALPDHDAIRTWIDEAKLVVDQVGSYTHDLDKISYANGAEEIRFRNGSRVRFTQRNRYAGAAHLRGIVGDVLYFDTEPTQEEMHALYPVMAARPESQIWIGGTNVMGVGYAS